MPKLRKGIDFNDTYTCQEKDFYCLGQRSWSKKCTCQHNFSAKFNE